MAIGLSGEMSTTDSPTRKSDLSFAGASAVRASAGAAGSEAGACAGADAGLANDEAQRLASRESLLRFRTVVVFFPWRIAIRSSSCWVLQCCRRLTPPSVSDSATRTLRVVRKTRLRSPDTRWPSAYSAIVAVVFLGALALT